MKNTQEPVKHNKYGDNNKELRIRTSDLLVLKEALLLFRRHLKKKIKEHDFGTQDYYVVDDLMATNDYIIDRIDSRYSLDYRQLDDIDRKFYTRLRKIYRVVRK